MQWLHSHPRSPKSSNSVDNLSPLPSQAIHVILFKKIFSPYASQDEPRTAHQRANRDGHPHTSPHDETDTMSPLRSNSSPLGADLTDIPSNDRITPVHIHGNVAATYIGGDYITKNTVFNNIVTPLPEKLAPRTVDSYEMSKSLRDILHANPFLWEDPSVLQIARVHDRKWEEVARVLQLIYEDLDGFNGPIEYFSNVKISTSLKSCLLNRAEARDLWIDKSKHHAQVAYWCLLGKITFDARNISYASEHWASHVCNAEPSPELYRALRDSPLPFRPTSNKELPRVIRWLEKDPGDSQRDLIARLQVHHKSMGSRLEAGIKTEVMGGAVSVVLKN
ncbi:hypothetical protein C8J57DRAFT_1336144 [Mycena rebaudengoi]|nr:hypothetical protein C8J57DRAFT_1336144 [Mycena rebaudengoi]